MLENVSIFMPTRGRTEKKLQITLKVLHPEVRKHIIMVCHPGEKQIHEKNWNGQLKEIIEVGGLHIGEIRQKCIDLSETDYIIFVDDSLDFHVRSESEKGTITQYPLKGMIEKHFNFDSITRYQLNMFSWIESKLISDKYGMVGISRRSSNCHHLEIEELENERVCSFWGINRKLFNSLPGSPKFSEMPLKEDFFIVLNFLTNGIPIITSYKYAYGRIGGANSKGGCSIYRKLDLSNKSAEMLKDYFPDFVSIVDKGTKSWGGEFGEKALDVRVSCKKAFEYGSKDN